MKKLSFYLSFGLLLCLVISCASTEKVVKADESEETGAAGTIVFADIPGNTGNLLEERFGSIKIVVDTEVVTTKLKRLSGATVEAVEFAGKPALKVTPNSKKEVRVAFLLEEPAALTGITTLRFSVAGFQGWEGHYNCGLFYTSKTGSDYKGSFYVGSILENDWTTVEANLKTKEQWGKNFSENNELYCIQIWSGNNKTMYITDLTLE